MSTLEAWLVSCLWNSVWQVPLLFVAGLLASRVVRACAAVSEHRVWVTVLLLQAAIPGLSSLTLPWLDPMAWTRWIHGTGTQGLITVQIGPGTVNGVRSLPAALLMVIAVFYAACILFAVSRFAWRYRQVRALRATASAVTGVGQDLALLKQPGSTIGRGLVWNELSSRHRPGRVYRWCLAGDIRLLCCLCHCSTIYRRRSSARCWRMSVRISNVMTLPGTCCMRSSHFQWHTTHFCGRRGRVWLKVASGFATRRPATKPRVPRPMHALFFGWRQSCWVTSRPPTPTPSVCSVPTAWKGDLCT